MRLGVLAIALGAVLTGFATAQMRSIELAIGTLSGPGFTATAVRLALDRADLSRARLQIGALEAFGRRWGAIAVTCSAFRLDRSVIACDQGAVEGPIAIALSFTYNRTTGAGRLAAALAPKERWDVAWTAGAPREAVLRFTDAATSRIELLAPDLPIKVSAGTASGTVRASMGNDDLQRVSGEIALQGVAFSDPAGQHAGEGIAGKIALRANAAGVGWQWNVEGDWSDGEVYWDPVYSKGGYRLTAAGVLTPTAVTVESARLLATDIGEVRVSAVLDRAPYRLQRLRAQTGALAVAALYARFLQPLLRDTSFGELRSEGRVRGGIEWAAGELTAVNVELDDVSVEDARGRFALFGVYADLPWRRSARAEGRIGMSGAEVQRLPIGAVGATLVIDPDEVRAAQLAIPVLSGLLTLHDLRLRNAASGVAWEVQGVLTPVPLDVLLAHFGLPAMQGSIAGEIPRVRYEASTLQIDGMLLMHVFDGTVTATNVKIASPLGLAPRLEANLAARSLDLGLVTRAFSFGHITGKVDARADGLVLSNWRPVQFDARIESSPGNYPKRISQTAVSNISALGGAGAAAAIQRSVLRFFETFGYARLGLSCRLENGVCQMGGIEDVPQGYVIVKGGGIPAINVLGYNRAVGWNELITRLQRVIDANVKPTIE